MKESRKKLLRNALVSLLIFALDMVGIWLVYFLAFGLKPAGAAGWFWLITIGLFGRFIVHCIVGVHSMISTERRWKAVAAAHGGLTKVIVLKHHEVANLLTVFGGDDGTMAVTAGDASWHSGPGVYAWHVDYPEDGSVLISVPRLVKRELPA